MESPLKCVLDYKIVFDSLCDSNGMVRIETLSTRWPASFDSDSKVPQGCLNHWSKCADKDGYLDWSAFSVGLQLALSEDSARVQKLKDSDVPRSKAEQRLASLRKGTSAAAPSLSKVTQADIEGFLTECNREALTKALKRMRKDAYKSQLSLHRMTSSAANTPVKKSTNTSEERPARANSGGSIVIKEKDELVYGLEVLEKARKWYKERLKLVATGDQSKTVKTEELLAVLQGGRSSKSEMLQHLKEINDHLTSLASPAPALTAEQQSRLQAQLQKLSQPHPQKPVGPPPAHVGQAVVEFSIGDQPDSAGVIIEPPSSRKPPQPRQPSSDTHRQPMKAHGHEQRGSREKYSSINPTQLLPSREGERKRSGSKPKRAHSFTSPPRVSAPDSNEQGSITDYPGNRVTQYPLRGTASMQDLQPKVMVQRSNSTSGQLSKSSSVTRISSGHHGSFAPGLMHQQVYNSGMSSSTQTLPSSFRHHRHAKSESKHKTSSKDTSVRLGDSIQSLV